MLNFYLLFPLTIFITCEVSMSWALRILMLDVPSPTIVGESVELSCSYDLEGDKLYSVKWYKNDVEFYRYVPKDWPPGQFLPMQGIRVDLSRSGKSSVYLKHVDLHSAGIYRCETSAEAPSFNTAEMEKDMKVFVLPTEGPRITGGRATSKPGDVITVNCTSAKSKPAAQLRWFINDNPIDATKIGAEYETVFSTGSHGDGLETSSLGLKFVVGERHFKHSNMRIKCSATISRMYTMSNEFVTSEVGTGQPPTGLHVSENLSQVLGNGVAQAQPWPLHSLLLAILLPPLVATLLQAFESSRTMARLHSSSTNPPGSRRGCL